MIRLPEERAIVAFTQELFQFILWAMENIGLPGLFLLMMIESFGIPPLPSEVILPFAGALIVLGTPGYSWPAVLVAAVGGSLLGAILAYEMGRWVGRPFLRRWGMSFGIREREIQQTEEFFDKHGPLTVGISRMIPILRAYISYPAGAAQMNRVSFAVYTVLGAIPFTALLVYLGVILGSHYTELGPIFQAMDYVVLVGVCGVAIYLIRRHHRQLRHWLSSHPT